LQKCIDKLLEKRDFSPKIGEIQDCSFDPWRDFNPGPYGSDPVPATARHMRGIRFGAWSGML
jgi:hypothetical protein